MSDPPGVERHRRRERGPAPRPQEWPRRLPAHRAPTDHHRAVIVLILAVLIVVLVLGSVVAITRSTVTVPGIGTPATTR